MPPPAGAHVAVVTGANRGLGRAIAVRLAADGYLVAATARDVASLEETCRDGARVGGRAVALPCDVADEASVGALAEQVSSLGPVHTVVANAGIAGPTTPLHELTLAEWRDCVRTDLDGVFLTFRAFIPGLVERHGGSLIAISSMTGKRPLAGRTPYAAAKMGVIGLVRTLALEVGPHQIRVNAVCPGAVAGPRIGEVTRRQAALLGISEEDALAAFTGPSPLGRLVEPEDVAAACAYLASDAAASVTGEDLNVTAGVVMY